MDTIRIKQERAAALKKAKALHTQAATERRDLSATEKKDFDEALAEAERANAQLERDAQIRLALGHAGRGGDGLASGDAVGDHEFRNWFGGVLRGLFPADGEQRDVLTTNFGGAGGAVVPTDYVSQLWDKLRPQTVALASGPRIINTNRHQVAIPHLTGDIPGAWLAENGTLSETDATGESITVTPTKFGVLNRVSREMADDSNPAIIDIILSNMVKSIAEGVDTAFFNGTGSSNQPTGLKNTSGITTDTTSFGANGNTFSGLAAGVDPILSAVATLQAANVDPSQIVIAMATRSWGEITKLKDSQGRYLVQGLQGVGGAPAMGLHRYRVLLSNNIPINETQGTNSDCSSIYVWAANQVAVVRSHDMRLERSVDAYFSQDAVGLRAITRIAFAVPNPTAVVRIAGVR